MTRRKAAPLSSSCRADLRRCSTPHVHSRVLPSNAMQTSNPHSTFPATLTPPHTTEHKCTSLAELQCHAVHDVHAVHHPFLTRNRFSTKHPPVMLTFMYRAPPTLASFLPLGRLSRLLDAAALPPACAAACCASPQSACQAAPYACFLTGHTVFLRKGRQGKQS